MQAFTWRLLLAACESAAAPWLVPFGESSCLWPRYRHSLTVLDAGPAQHASQADVKLAGAGHGAQASSRFRGAPGTGCWPQPTNLWMSAHWQEEQRPRSSWTPGSLHQRPPARAGAFFHQTCRGRSGRLCRQGDSDKHRPGRRQQRQRAARTRSALLRAALGLHGWCRRTWRRRRISAKAGSVHVSERSVQRARAAPPGGE